MRYLLLTFIFVPTIVLAQSAQTFVTNVTNWLGTVFVPFLVGIAFLFFVFNVFRYFVAGGGDKDAQEKARAAATYGVLAFALLVVFWGIIAMLTSSIGLDGATQPKNDYVDFKDGGSSAPPYCPPGEPGPC